MIDALPHAARPTRRAAKAADDPAHPRRPGRRSTPRASTSNGRCSPRSGFAVVAANPRGSSGYGRDFSRAIWADWGNKDYDDVMAAVDTAIAMGVADPDRLGVGGWSYGGILTDHVIIEDDALQGGDLRARASSTTSPTTAPITTSAQWEAELGLPWQNPALWMKLSPFYRLDKIATPTLVMGGDADMNVPILGGQQLYQGLRRARPRDRARHLSRRDPLRSAARASSRIATSDTWRGMRNI